MSCEVCGKTEQLKTCAKCLQANYCCREHQIAHWQIHKQWCNNPLQDTSSTSSSLLMNNPNTNNILLQDQNNQIDIGNYYDQNQQMNYLMDDNHSQSMNMFGNIGQFNSQQLQQQQTLQQQQNNENIVNYEPIPETVSVFYLFLFCLFTF